LLTDAMKALLGDWQGQHSAHVRGFRGRSLVFSLSPSLIALLHLYRSLLTLMYTSEIAGEAEDGHRNSAPGSGASSAVVCRLYPYVRKRPKSAVYLPRVRERTIT